MKKFTMLFVGLMMIGSLVVNAQQKTITGKVTSSDDGMSLPGVSVSVKGTTTGTITNVDGNYTLGVSADAQALVFSFVGMKTKEVLIGSTNVIDVVMEPDVIGVDEVIVTALGVSREKKSLGYAVQEVSGDELTKGRDANVINSISGKVAGVQIKANTNMGGSSNVIIRGSTSLTGNNQALFVIDGIPMNNENTNNRSQLRGGSGYDYGNPVSDINPDDIESMTVLKGAAATALYGSRAANGVIIITTKRGKKSAEKTMSVSLNSSTMFHTFDKKTFPEYQTNYGPGYGPYYSGGDHPGLMEYDFDGDGTLDLVTPTTEDASMGEKFDPSLMVYQWDSFYPESPNYMKKTPFVAGANGPASFFETGRTLTNGFDITGGTKASTFRFGYTNTDGTGILPNSLFKKNNFSFNASFDILDDLTISTSVNWTNTYTKGRNHTGYNENIMSSFRQWFQMGVDIGMQKQVYESSGKNISWNPNSENNLAPIYWDNPYFARYESYQDDSRNRLIGYSQLDWKINDFLSVMGRVSVDTYGFIQEERRAVGSVSGRFGVGRTNVTSGYALNNITFMETNMDVMLKFKKNLTEDLNLNAFVGTNVRRSKFERSYSSTNGGLAVPGTFALSNSVSPMLPPEQVLEEIGVNGYFISASIGWRNMLFVDGTYRYDISSTLPSDNRAYGYPSIAASFLFSEVVDASWLSLGKLRLSYAKVGNDAQWGTVNSTYTLEAPFGGSALVSIPREKNNEKLKPELSGSLEGGLELNMFKNRLGFDLALYKVNTVNQVLPLAVSRVTGYSSKWVNIGEVENKGVELQLRGTVVKTTDFSWDITLNWSKNINEVISLGDDIENLQIASLQGGVTINAREGEPYGAIQGTDYRYAPDGQKIVLSNGYYDKTGTSDKVIGNITPDWNSGIMNTFNYKSWSASFLIDMQVGGSIFSLDQWYGMGTGLYAETDYSNDLGNPVRDGVTADGTSGGLILDGVVEIVDGNGDVTGYEANTTRVSGGDYRVFGWSRNPNAGFIYDANYVKLRELSISYSIPKNVLQKTFIKGATFSFIGSNLLILSKDLPHADPEASQGAGNIQGWQSGVMPSTRNLGFSIKLQF